MESFKGSYNELQAAVANAGLAGDWKDSGANKQFRHSDSGGILMWSPNTSRVWYQGPTDAAANLKMALQAGAATPGVASGTCQ